MQKETGTTAEERRTYSKDSKQVSVLVLQTQDPSAAYEWYTYALRPGAKALNLGQNSADINDYADIQVGNFVIGVGHLGNISPDELSELVKILREKADGTPTPPIRDYLPDTGRIAGTERYALGPVAFRAAADALGQHDAGTLVDLAGFSSGAEAIFARYKTGAHEAVLLLIDYPTPQLAELHLRHLQRALLATTQDASVERKGSLLSMVLAPSSPEYAEKLRSAVNYETQVTWNEPSQTATDPPWSTVLGKIFIGTGLFMVVAVVMGVAFGGVRVITKRFFPGKVFDRPEQMEVLQLGLSGKPIDPRDLY
jgi:hypothetical protein